MLKYVAHNLIKRLSKCLEDKSVALTKTCRPQNSSHHKNLDEGVGRSSATAD